MTLGGLYQEQKRWAEAEAEFEAAIAAQPKESAPRASLARMYFAQGQIPQAEKVLVDAKAQLPDDPAAYRMLGDTYLARGEMAKASTNSPLSPKPIRVMSLFTEPTPNC